MQKKNVQVLQFGLLVAVLTLLLAVCFAVPSYASDDDVQTLTSGETYIAEEDTFLVTDVQSSDETTVLITAGRTGDMAVAGYNIDEGYVTLYDANGHRLSRSMLITSDEDIMEYQRTLHFAVTAGKTYCLEFSDVTTDDGSDVYGFWYENDSYKDSSGASKKTAKTIRTNKTYYAVLPAGKTSSRWMKVKLKKGKFKLNEWGLVSDDLSIYCFPAKGTIKNFDELSIALKENDDDYNYYSYSTVTKSGYLYIEISRPYSYSAGIAAIKVNQ